MASGSGKEAPKEGDFRMPDLRGAKTTKLFRSVNPELTVRPNKPVMAFGLVTISLCVGYLGYLHATKRTTRSCMTLLTVKGRKTSKWD